MKILELFLDSYLKRFQLFQDAQTLLRGYYENNPVEGDPDLDETVAKTLFSDFLDLAQLLDTYQNWGQEEWVNFLMMMMQAYKEKGKEISINCALAALGVVTSEPISVTDGWALLDDNGNVKRDENGILYIWGNHDGEDPTLLPPEDEGWTFVSYVNIRIDTLYTPTVDKFLEELESLLPRLMWLHDTKASDASISQVLVQIDLNEKYQRTTYDNTLYFSKLDIYSEEV